MKALDDMAEYYGNLDNTPPKYSVEPGYLYSLIAHSVPEEPESFEAVQRDVKDTIMLGITH
ncbi:hypothetical protein GGF44_005772, partial [Coemansia sp. RSA 1694]